MMSAWDNQGKPTELPAVRADLEAVQAAMTDLQEYANRHEALKDGGGQSASAPK